MYVRLKRGDRLPTVAYGQWLLNRHPAVPRGSVAVDGIFGPNTEQAVLSVQRVESFPETGQLEPPMWLLLRIRSGDDRRTIESLGIGSTGERSRHGIDPSVLGDREYLGDGDPGVSIFVQGGSSFGLPGAVDRIVAGRRYGRCVLLRFHGHGAPGLMVVTGGGGVGSELYPHRGDGYPRILRRLRPLFGPFGSIELHGCRVAAGSRGRRSLEILAEAVNVPASAAHQTQYGGSESDRFEGPVRTVFPGGMSLRDWAEAQEGHQCALRA